MSAKPALSMGTKKVSGNTRMECPTCGFKWARPPGEDNKPCPKCGKALPKGAKGVASPPKAVVKPRVAAAPKAASPPKAAAPAAAASDAPAAAAGGGDAAPANEPAPAAAAAPKKAGAKPALSMGEKKKFAGQKMECPTCAFKWSRPPGEDNKPCPKCGKAIPKGAAISKSPSSPSKSSSAGASSKGGSIFDKLTDPKQYTGAHKARFDADGKGKGIAGRY